MNEISAIIEFRHVGEKILRYQCNTGISMLQEDHEYRQLPELRKRHRELHKILHTNYGYTFTQLDTLT